MTPSKFCLISLEALAVQFVAALEARGVAAADCSQGTFFTLGSGSVPIRIVVFKERLGLPDNSGERTKHATGHYVV